MSEWEGGSEGEIVTVLLLGVPSSTKLLQPPSLFPSSSWRERAIESHLQASEETTRGGSAKGGERENKDSFLFAQLSALLC
jgi:hypothetical protein